MSLVFVDRSPTDREVERIRLILSTFQDGTGMLKQGSGNETLPGWRDFERTIALAFAGEAPETKAVFDVLLEKPANPGVKYGLSCKMRGELNRIQRDGQVTIEVSNSAQKFWECLAEKGLDQTNYKEYPRDAGIALVELVEQWHQETVTKNIDISKSFFLVLSWNRSGWYQLHQFQLELPNPRLLEWQFPLEQRRGVEERARRLRGSDDTVSFLSGMASQVDNSNIILLNPGLSGNQYHFSLNLCEQIWNMAFWQKLLPIFQRSGHGRCNLKNSNTCITCA